MRDATNLRARLRERLRQVIGHPVVEAKELAAFDLIMSRRQFLKASQYTAIAGLIAAGTPPTLWGRRDADLAVDPAEVGLTVADQASATAATQLTVGTELFEETIYAEPPVSSEAVGSHAVIEGARGRLRLQSDLTSTDPEETAFLDTGFHWGPPELIQLEDTSGGWELVHYHHPWSLRADGATTDGMIRQVIMGTGAGLVSPTQVLTITGTNSNRVVSGSSQSSGVTYAVVVLDAGAPGGGHVCVGAGAWNIGRPYAARPSYPVRWTSTPLTTFGPPKSAERAEKYTFTGYHDTPTYNPGSASEHVVLYYPGGLAIVSLNNGSQPGTASLEFALLDYPDNNTAYRVVHIGSTIALARTTNTTQGSEQIFTIDTASVDTQNGTKGSTKPLLGSTIDWYQFSLVGVGYSTGTATSQSTVGPVPNFAGIGDVHDLFTGTDSLGFKHHVKLARFGGAVALFVMGGDALVFEGLFPLAFPDAAGVGIPTTLSGGVSKFGGFRFVVSDTDGNVFLMRQRRLAGQDSPYTAPIYAQFDATGAAQPSYDNTNDVDYDDPPSTTASTSNLNQLLAWVQSTVPAGEQNIINISHNLLLNTALAFGSDDTNSSQAIWLGSMFQAAYAPKRFPHDSEHIEIKLRQGSSTQYAAYLAVCNPVTRTWHERQIASQVLPKDPGLNESGDHYQATIAGANAYGRPVSLALGANADLLIEVRADAPTTVVDDTHNLYYDIDRYTSFMAAPDPSSGRLGVVVKAETFAQVLYVRLVDTSGLQPSGGDTAMLSAQSVTTYPWLTVNLAAQAQQRMGNDGTTTIVALLGDDAPLVDTTQYISGPNLYTDGDAANWTYKTGFGPPSGPDDANLGSLATYLNTSGQNLIAATPQLGLGAASDTQEVDPLTAVTAVPSQSLTPNSTAFTYPSGTIGSPASNAPHAPTEPGSIWSGISHALHDALHWLQNVSADVYKDFQQGAVTVAMAADSITCTVSADIMQAVNGVDSELTEIVSTVEEYANVLVNLVVTIVEQSFLYKLIAEIIALISLFYHLKDIQDLSDSLYSTFTGLPALPTGSSWDTYGSDYIGTDNALTNATGVNDGASSVPDELVTALLDAIFGNPFTKKILNKVLAYLSQFLGGLLPAPPIGFQLPRAWPRSSSTTSRRSNRSSSPTSWTWHRTR